MHIIQATNIIFGLQKGWNCSGCSFLNAKGSCQHIKHSGELEIYNGKCLNKWRKNDDAEDSY